MNIGLKNFGKTSIIQRTQVFGNQIFECSGQFVKFKRRLARDTQIQRAIPIQEKLAATRRRLANGNSYRTISRTLAIDNSTAVQFLPYNHL